MTAAKVVFDNAWARCDILAATHAFTSKQMTSVFESDEILRAEWVARISALDLYIHELISQGMLAIFEKTRTITPSFEKFSLPFKVSNSISDNLQNPTSASSIFDLEIRRQLGFQTFQNSKSLSDGIRLICTKELWKEIALHQGAAVKQLEINARALKLQLDILVDRRNKIAHEGDMQPLTPRCPWPISSNDLVTVRNFISKLVTSIDAIV